MEKEQKLYDKFVDILLDKLDGEITPKELEIVMKFLDNQNIQATQTHQGLNEITEKVMNLPFEEDRELPLKRIK